MPESVFMGVAVSNELYSAKSSENETHPAKTPKFELLKTKNLF